MIHLLTVGSRMFGRLLMHVKQTRMAADVHVRAGIKAALLCTAEDVAVHVFGMNWSPKQDPSHNVRCLLLTTSCRFAHLASLAPIRASAGTRHPLAVRVFFGNICAQDRAFVDLRFMEVQHAINAAQGEAERSYVQKLERLGKLTVHPTPCAGHRSCDEVTHSLGCSWAESILIAGALHPKTFMPTEPCIQDRQQG